MHSLASLLAGVRGAEDGTADLYRRGTTTRATWYATFEGDDADSSGDPIVLDANGGAEVYVNEVVDVLVKNIDGDVVRSFTDGYSANSIEVRSQSFTGTDYDDASTGRGSNFPVTLAAILDLWKTATGSFDWKVLLGGSSTSLVTALGSLTGLVFNVKAYGAVGDGATDDTAAVNAALAAAFGGGIVFFPAGTYRITTELEVFSQISLLGVGSAKSIITTDHASNHSITFSGTNSTAPNRVQGLSIVAAQANTGSRVRLANSQNIVFRDCYLGGSNAAGTVLREFTAAGAFACAFVDCVIAGSAKLSDIAGTTSARKRFVRCSFVVTSASYTNTMVLEKDCDLVDCTFDASAATAGTLSMFGAKSTTLNATLRGCKFLATGGATGTAITLGSYTSTSKFEESMSDFNAGLTAYGYDCINGGNSKGAAVRLNSRIGRRYEVTSNANPLTALPFDQYGLIVVKRSTNADQVVALFDFASTTTPPDASRSKLVVWNASGGAIATERIDIISGLTIMSHTTVANTQSAVIEFDLFVLSDVQAAIAPTIVTDIQAFFA